MQTNWRIGSLLGIPLFLDPSWFFILVLLTFLNALDLSRRFDLVLAWSAGLGMALLLFASVLLHELGHSLVARSQGIKVNSITLFIFGGVASIERESKTPGQAFQVAIAGPAVSLALFGLLYSLAQTLPNPSIGQAVALELSSINLILAVFNLIPGLPLDGGQVLKAAIWKLTGSRIQGVRWAAQTGKLLGGVAIIVGLYLVLVKRQPFAIWLVLIGGYVFRNAAAYDRLTTLQEVLLQVMASETMTSDFRVVDANQTLRSFIQEYSKADLPIPLPYYAAASGRYRGFVAVEDLQLIERSRWDIETLESIVRPLSEIAAVEEKTSLASVINQLEAEQVNHLTVLSPAGAVAGVIDRGDIVRVIAKKLNLPITETDIKRIKAEGVYPAGLQLHAIAQSAMH